jgi:hypothetical protein
VARLANSLGRELGRAEAQKGSDANNPDPIDLNSAWLGCTLVADDKESIASARDHFERAMKLEPQKR